MTWHNIIEDVNPTFIKYLIELSHFYIYIIHKNVSGHRSTDGAIAVHATFAEELAFVF